MDWVCTVEQWERDGWALALRLASRGWEGGWVAVIDACRVRPGRFDATGSVE